MTVVEGDQKSSLSIVLYIDPWQSRQSEMHLCEKAEEEAEASGRYERI